MVRNVRSRSKGYSVVEIMVSMVILSIVALIMTHILSSTARSHNKASDDDAGDAIALEILAELQNKVIPALSRTTDSTIIREKQTFNCRWFITAGTPPRCSVSVKWTDGTGKLNESNIIGYIESDNACPDQGSGYTNNAVTDVLIYPYLTASSAFSTAELANSNKMEVGNADYDAHRPIARLAPVDADYQPTAATPILKDKFSYRIKELNNVGSFYMSGDTLKSAVTLPYNSVYTVDVEIVDCRGTAKKENLEILIGAKSTVPAVPVKTFEMEENTASGNVGQMFGQCTGTIQWSTTSPYIEIDAGTGAITLKSGHPVLNYEVNTDHTIDIPVTAKNTTTNALGDQVTVTCKIKLTDVPELPTQVKMTNAGNSANQYHVTIPSTKSVGTLIAKLIITDDDPVNYSFTVTPSAYRVDSRSDGYYLVLNSPVTVGNTDISINVIDGPASSAGSFNTATSQTNQLKVIVQNAPLTDCTAKTAWSSSSGYAANAVVKYNGHLYKAANTITAESISPDIAIDKWTEDAGCQ